MEGVYCMEFISCLSTYCKFRSASIKFEKLREGLKVEAWLELKENHVEEQSIEVTQANQQRGIISEQPYSNSLTI